MDFELLLGMEQKQIISSSQIQSLEILAMDNVEIEKMMEMEYMENPLLEQEIRKNENLPVNQLGEGETLKKEIRFHDNTQEIREFIFSQISINQYSQKELTVMGIMIESLDDNGFFSYDDEEFAKKQKIEITVLKKCISVLRELEPYGIFSKDLKECLLKQLEMIGERDEMIELLLTEYLSDLASGKIAKISRATGWSTLKIKKYLQKIRSLNPRPMMNYSNPETASYIVPDILVNYSEDKKCLIASLNDEWLPNYGISDYYYQMMISAKKDEEIRIYFEKKYQRAKFLISSIEQRRETILKVTNHVAEKQFEFLTGQGTKKAETMSDAAKELDVAVSTISRAIRGKYIQGPSGGVFLKELFSASVSKVGEREEHTADEVKKRIKVFITAEDKKKPLSDMEIARKMQEEGICVSRRAIAKYRDIMGIKGSFERKEFE